MDVVSYGCVVFYIQITIWIWFLNKNCDLNHVLIFVWHFICILIWWQYEKVRDDGNLIVSWHHFEREQEKQNQNEFRFFLFAFEFLMRCYTFLWNVMSCSTWWNFNSKFTYQVFIWITLNIIEFYKNHTEQWTECLFEAT